MKRWVVGLTAGLLTGMSTGCHSFGPDSLEGTHFRYNQAIVTSLNEQFLQNLVRLRYRDAPYFLEIGSVTASLKLEASIGLGTELSTGSGSDLFTPSAGIGYSTTPTISYAPLSGDDFLKNVLTPISLDSLFVLTQSGWSSKRVFGLCVERFNHLENAPSASGPTPSYPPTGYESFLKLLDLFESIRRKEFVRSAIDVKTGQLVVQMQAAPGDEAVVAEIKQMLDLNPKLSLYPVDRDFLQNTPDTLSLRTRSIMSMLFYLSQTVEVPAAHEKAGWVTTTQEADGTRFDWGKTPAGSLFKVRVSAHRPKTAYLVIPHRGHWFYIDNSDLESKSTFMLISQLFSLQAGQIKSMAPTLTIPVSR